MNNISAALVAALAEMPAVPFDEENPFLKNKFSSLGAVIRTAQPILAKHKLAVVQLVTSDDIGRIGVETRLVHESGEYLTSTIYLPMIQEKGKSDAQVAGSIISYLRRYSLAAMLCMYSDQDVDGNQPQPKAQPPQLKQESKPAKMSLDSAMAVQSSEGKAYGDLDTSKLTFMHNSIVKKLNLTDLPAAEREPLEYKRDAIETIIAARMSNSAATDKPAAAG